MTKQELINLLYSVIDGRKEYSIEEHRGGYIHVYSDDNLFTATLITRLVEKYRDYFIGVTCAFDGRPYLLFTL